MSDGLNTEIKIGADASGVEAGVGRAKRSLKDLGDSAARAGKDAGTGIGAIGAGGDKAAKDVERSTKSIQGQLQRAIASFESGEKGSRKFYESLASQRGADVSTLKPLLDQLDAYKTKAQEAARASDSAPFKRIGGSVMELAQAFTIAGAAVKAAEAVVQNFGKAVTYAIDSAKMAARYETLGVVMQTVGRNAGYTGQQMHEAAKGVQALGITMMESRDSVTKMASAQIDLANASKLARIAQDAAVIGGVNSSEALKSMVHGIQSAQTDVLRTIGINVSFEESYKKLAAQLGTTTEALSEQEKTTARTNAVLESGAKIAGAYEDAMGTAGKQMTSLARYSEDAQVKLGAVFNESLLLAIATYTGHLKESNASLDELTKNKSLETWSQDMATTFAFVADSARNSFSVITGTLDTLYTAMLQVSRFTVGDYKGMAQAGRGWSARMGDRLDPNNQMQVQLDSLRAKREQDAKTLTMPDKSVIVFETPEQKQAYQDGLAGIRKFVDDRKKILETAQEATVSVLRKNRTDQQKIDDEIARYRKTQTDAGIDLSSAEVKAAEAAIRARAKAIPGVKAAQSEYDKLIASIKTKIAQNAEEIANGGRLNEAEKLRAKLTAEIEQGTRKMTAARLADAQAQLKQLDASERAKQLYLDQQKFEGARDKEAAAIADEIAKIEAKAQALEDEATAYGKTATELQALTIARLQDNKAIVAGMDSYSGMIGLADAEVEARREAHRLKIAQIDAEIAALSRLGAAQTAIADLKLGASVDEIVRASNAQTAAYRDEFRLIGLTATERAKVTAARKVELDYAKKIADLDKSGASDAKKDSERIRLRAQEQIESAAAVGQAIQTEWSKTVDQYDDLFRTGFQQMILQGEDGIKAFGKTLKAQVYTSIADAIYQALARKFVVNIVGNFIGGGAGGAMQALAGGGGGGVMGLANNASSAYSLYSNLGAVSSGLGAFGNSLLATSQSMMGMTGTTAQMVQSLQSAGYWTGSAATTSATTTGAMAGGGGAGASSGMAGMGAFAGYAAIVALVANAMGAFRSDKSVGGGLTGTLGKGDISGYELWREGGTLFDGPNFATKNPSELIARYESQLEALRGSGEGSSQPAFKLQTEITQLQREYGAQIEATRKQSGALQLAYDGMRANVGNMADALGLGSAKVRDWTMAFGTDAVHPDLGGTAVIFDGLKDEEIAVKIQEALASANNTLAELVLGEWVTTTEEIRRTLESTAPIYGDMEIPGAWDEVTESVTRTTYVASQYARENEKAIDTLTRLAVSLGSVNQVFDALGVSAYEASLAGGDLASKLIDMLGGGEAFAAITGSYYENYYSEAERMGKATEALAAELAKAGVAMPTTKDAYRAIVTEALEAGEAGQALAAKLLGLSSAFAQVADYAEQAAEAMSERSRQEIENLKQLARTQAGLWADLAEAQGDMATAELRRYWIETEGMTLAEQAAYDYNAAIKVQISAAKEAAAAAKKLADAERSLIAERANAAQQAYGAAKSATDAAMAALERSVDVERDIYNSARDAAQEAANEVRNVIDALASNIKDLYREVNSTLRMGATAGLDFVANALQNARLTGYLPDAKDLAEAIAGARAGMGAENYASQFESDRERLILAGQLSDLAGYAEPQLTAAEKAVKQAEAQLKSLDGILKTAKDQLDASRGIDTSVKTIPEALASLQAAITGELQAQTQAFVTALVGKLSAGQIKPQDAVKQYQDATGNYVPHEKWFDAAGTNAYISTGGAAALGGEKNVRDAAIHSKTGEQTTVGAAVDFVAEAIKTGDLYSIYAAAVRHGISSVSLDTMMGWPGGTSLDWAKQNNLPAFAVGTNYVPRDMVAQIHEGEAIVPKAFNPWAGGQGGSGGAEVVTELRALREENRQQAGEIARLNLRMARVLERWDGDGAPPKREEATV